MNQLEIIAERQKAFVDLEAEVFDEDNNIDNNNVVENAAEDEAEEAVIDQ